jgi:RNA polymerase sigma-70 factor (ECF subfamily)
MTPACTSSLLRREGCQASLLVATAGFKPDDWEDLRQELTLDCLRRSPKFDPSRGDWQGFVRGIVRNHACVLATRRYRTAQREVLAADLVGGEEQVGDDSDILDGVRRHEMEAALQMSIDVERVLGGLPTTLQTLARLLAEMPVLEVCARTGRSRSRVYQMTRQLREVFVQAGFRPRSPRRLAAEGSGPSRSKRDIIAGAAIATDASNRPAMARRRGYNSI